MALAASMTSRGIGSVGVTGEVCSIDIRDMVDLTSLRCCLGISDIRKVAVIVCHLVEAS